MSSSPCACERIYLTSGNRPHKFQLCINLINMSRQVWLKPSQLELRRKIALACWQCYASSPAAIRAAFMRAMRSLAMVHEPLPFSRAMFKKLLLHFTHENQCSQWMPRLSRVPTAMSQKQKKLIFVYRKTFLALRQPNGLACIKASFPVGFGNIALIKEKHYLLIAAC